MKALEVATALNNASLKGEVWADVLVKERDALAAKVSQLEGGAAVTRSVVEKCDLHIAALEKKMADARTALEQAAESSRKLVEEKVTLDESLKKADLPGEDETEDTAVLKRADMIEKVSVLERSLVDAVKLGFDRAVAQLKVANSGIDLCVEGTHHLSDVEDRVIKPPPVFEVDIGHVDDA
ncbi:hypothetical protein MtrunA17_Chr2g0304611 [Medicago truncatula]|uniref:Uncharacterized protein n=1 Tax=Medicago truncatula TaxID=3880 RepID=A0A396J9H7_MEDTR|nr:hypothetical protein MtrunA17_Chr2g0304611 [Medicago truncatula]